MSAQQEACFWCGTPSSTRAMGVALAVSLLLHGAVIYMVSQMQLAAPYPNQRITVIEQAQTAEPPLPEPDPAVPPAIVPQIQETESYE